MNSLLNAASSRVKYALGGWFAPPLAPTVGPDTFFVWEPCSHSHTEVVPGYTKYLRELGFNVIACLSDDAENIGLFSRYEDPGITVLRRPQAAFLRYFRRHGLGAARGILVTTARKIGHKDHYGSEQRLFAGRRSGQKLLLVEHDVRRTTDTGHMHGDIITLAPVNYAAAQSTVVNPHYFGPVTLREKHAQVVRFVAVGALRARRRNTEMLIDAVGALHQQGLTQFRIAVIGSGSLEAIPESLRGYFEPHGRLDFNGLYREIEAADFVLALLDPGNAQHERYLTTGTSGTFQLVYGFCKPCVIAAKFAQPHGLDSTNSVVHADNASLAQAMRDAITMPAQQYALLQRALQSLSAGIAAQSLENLRRLAGDVAQATAARSASTAPGTTQS